MTKTRKPKLEIPKSKIPDDVPSSQEPRKKPRLSS